MATKTPSYKVRANDFEFEFTTEDLEAADIVRISPGLFNIIQKHRSVNVKLIAADERCKMMTLEVEGHKFEIEIKEELDQLMDQMGFGSASQQHIKEIKAPMPGLVLEILVAEGQEVNANDSLLILQAMKMENSIGIHASSIIKKIFVLKGQAVEKGQLLMELE